VSATVLHFDPPTAFVELVSPGTLKSGERFYSLVYYATEAEGGGHFEMWDGTDRREGLEAARDFQVEGVRFVDRTGDGGAS